MAQLISAKLKLDEILQWIGHELNGSAKTCYGVEMTEKQAAKTRAIFFKHYDGLARWHAKAWGEVERTEAVEGRTPLGTRRLINPPASNWDCFESKTNPENMGLADFDIGIP